MTYPLHPLAEFIPPASPEDFRALVASIQTVGQLEPIRTWQGQIIDGRHRLMACEQLGVEPVFRSVEPEEVDGGSDEALLAYVLGLNINRRHASTSQRALAAAKAITIDGKGRPKNGSIDLLSVEKSASLFNVSEASVKRARQLIHEADARVVELVSRGVLTVNAALESHEQLSAMAAEQEAQGVDADFEALARQIDKLKRTNAKLRRQNKELVAAGTDQHAQAKVYAGELERAKAELTKAQARLEAADKGLTVAPPKVQFKEDPEKDRQLHEQRERIAALKKAKAEAEHRAKYHATLLEKADAQLIDKSTRLAQLESPAEFLTAYTGAVIDDFNRRTRGAIGASKRSGLIPSPEMLHQVSTAKALLDELLELWRDRRAHEAELPALEVRS